MFIGAPTYRQLWDVTVPTFLKICPPGLILKFNKSERTILLRNGSKLHYRSLDNPNASRGYSVAYLRIDEGAYVTDQAWKTAIATVRMPGYPLQRIITSTPRGKNFVYDAWVKKKQPGYTLWNMRSSDNKSLPPDFESSLNYSGQLFNQEILGLFEAFVGLVYPTFHDGLVTHCDGLSEFKTVVAAVDWGWRDPAVILVMGMRRDGSVHLLDEWYMTSKTINDQIAAANMFKSIYRVKKFIADPSRPDLIQMFNTTGLLCEKGNNDILSGILAVNAFMPKLYGASGPLTVSPRCVNTLGELGSYAYKTAADGTEEKPINSGEKPVDFKNHAMDCLRYGIKFLTSKTTQRQRDIHF